MMDGCNKLHKSDEQMWRDTSSEVSPAVRGSRGCWEDLISVSQIPMGTNILLCESASYPVCVCTYSVFSGLIVGPQADFNSHTAF